MGSRTEEKTELTPELSNEFLTKYRILNRKESKRRIDRIATYINNGTWTSINSDPFKMLRLTRDGEWFFIGGFNRAKQCVKSGISWPDQVIWWLTADTMEEFINVLFSEGQVDRHQPADVLYKFGWEDGRSRKSALCRAIYNKSVAIINEDFVILNVIYDEIISWALEHFGKRSAAAVASFMKAHYHGINIGDLESFMKVAGNTRNKNHTPLMRTDRDQWIGEWDRAVRDITYSGDSQQAYVSRITDMAIMRYVNHEPYNPERFVFHSYDFIPLIPSLYALKEKEPDLVENAYRTVYGNMHRYLEQD